MKKILFSPLGLTDPIKNERDGSMLNICRFYDIDKVYLYMSKEIYGYHLHDNRYVYCIEMLGELLGKKIEYELIIREDLENVFDFDFFIGEFRQVLKDVYNQNKYDLLYVNISSGTPQMKSALNTLSVFSEINMIPVQITTPENSSNPRYGDKWDYNPEIEWINNKDNETPLKRNHECGNINFLLQIKKQMLAELINKYDYVGANTLAHSIADMLNADFIALLDAACLRAGLDYAKANNVYKKYGHKVLEYESSDAAPLTEYLLLLDLKIKRGELADFIRAVTPLLADLFELVLKECCSFNVNDFVSFKKSLRQWDTNKLKKSAPDVYNRFNTDYSGFRSGPVYSDHLLRAIDEITDNAALLDRCTELRDIETKIRNIAAHEIVSVNAEKIERLSGCKPQKIIDKIKTVFNFTSIKINNTFFLSYDRMNDILINYLKKDKK